MGAEQTLRTRRHKNEPPYFHPISVSHITQSLSTTVYLSQHFFVSTTYIYVYVYMFVCMDGEHTQEPPWRLVFFFVFICCVIVINLVVYHPYIYIHIYRPHLCRFDMNTKNLSKPQIQHSKKSGWSMSRRK